MRNILQYGLSVCFVFLCANILAQEKYEKADTIYHYEDKFFYKQQEFYLKWKAKAAKHEWSKELFAILFDPPTRVTPQPVKERSSSFTFLNLEGREIAKISFQIVKPFVSKDGEGGTDISRLERIGNSLHNSSKEKYLRKLLTLVKGDLLDIKQLEDNEEVLRSLPYIDELYINVLPLPDDRVEVAFLVKDKFSWSMSYQAHSLNAHKIKLYNKNLFGRGHYFKTSYFYSPNKAVIHNWGVAYYIPTLGKSKINVAAIVEHNNQHDRYSVALGRGFLDYKMKYAGGAGLNIVKRSERVPTNPIASFPNSIDYREVDAWAGFSLPYDLKKDDKYARYRKALTARLYHIDFVRRPEILRDSNVFLQNTTGALLGYNVSKKKLCLSNMIYNYGKVEQIPSGYLAQIFVGGAFNDSYRKGYLGFNFEKTYFGKKHDVYLGMRFSGGSFFDGGGLKDGLLAAEAKYISKLYRFKNTGHRHFIKLKYMLGLNPTHDFLHINESRGLRNFESNIARGDRKIVCNVESVFFSPYTIAGFRSTFFSFADVAYIQRTHSAYANADNFSAGVGLGLRLHNNNFVFETFQVSFSLFLKRPADVNFFRPDASSVTPKRFEQFRIEKPLFYFERENLR